MQQVAQLRTLARTRTLTRAESGVAEVAFPLRLGDAILTAGCSFVALWLWTVGRWAPEAAHSAWVYTGLALGPVVFRTLAFAHQKLKWGHTVANFWLLPVMVIGHMNFSPFVDSVNPRLYDAQLARMDGILFGGVPSFFTEGHVPAVAMDALLLCYYSYFLWPFILALVLYVKNRPGFCEFRSAMILFFVINFALYAAVPAVGPRFFFAGSYQGPLHGWLLTPLLDGAMRMTPFNRDCFPSGHTGFTLIVLVYAFQYARRFFTFMLPFACGLIAATILGRFHYGIDLVCALPLVLAVVSTAAMIARTEQSPGRKLATILRRAVQ